MARSAATLRRGRVMARSAAGPGSTHVTIVATLRSGGAA
jgi:hypothetical protein